MKAPLPWNEWERLAALKKYEVLDTAPEIVYDRITRLAARLFAAPIALVSLVDEQRQWFKSACGLELTQTDRDFAFCGYTILGNSVMCVPDTLEDSRFRDNGLVTGSPHLRFYAGAPLRNPEGFNMGSLCVLDTKARPPLTDEEAATLEDLAAIVVDELELRMAARALSKANEKLSVLAGSDPVTELSNRMAFDERLRKHLTDAPGETMAVMYLDLDRFRKVNDSFGGHAAGDQLLRTMGQHWRAKLPEGAMLARMGGDEFAALIPGIGSAEAEMLAKSLCDVLNRPLTIAGRNFDIGVSVGVAMYPYDAPDAQELLRRADRAMYEAKRQGGACFRMAAKQAS